MKNAFKQLMSSLTEIGFLFIFCIAFAHAEQHFDTHFSDQNYRVEYCQSNASIATIEQATQCDYQEKYSPLRSGLQGSTRWIRIQILSTQAESKADLFAIRVAPHLLKEMDFYQETNQGWSSEKAGRFFPKNDSFNDIGGYLFLANPTPKNANTYYLKIQTEALNHVWVTVKLWPNSDYQISEHLLGIGSQIGILLAIFVFSLVSAGFNPSTPMRRFTFSALNLLLCILSGSGILALYIFKQNIWLDGLVYHWTLCLRVGLWVWVSQAFLIGLPTPKWYNPSCNLAYGITGLALTLVAAGNPNLAIQILVLVAIFVPIIQITAIVKTPKIAKSLQIALISGFSIILLLIAISVLLVLFPLQNNSLTPLYLSRLMDYANPLVMLSIIVFQGRLEKKELGEVKAALSETLLKSEYEGKLLKDRGTLIDMLSHELKNPLTTISLAIEMLDKSMGPDKVDAQKRLKTISQSIMNMDAIIEHCSLMNSIDQKSLSLSKNTANLGEFIQSLLINLDCESRVELKIPNDLSINTDLHLLGIAIKNLVENALKYSPQNSVLSISANRSWLDKQALIHITVSNEVAEDLIPDENLIFQRFYRHPFALNIRGSGLGLSICKAICVMLNGNIRYQYLNKTVSFCIELPQ